MSRQDTYSYDFDKFRLDAGKQKLLDAGEPVALPPKAVELLLLLVENWGRIVEKEFLMESLWPDTVVEESNLTQNIYLLRKALGKTADGRSFIETHSKRGYKFIPDVQRIAAEEDATLVVSKLTQSRIRITQEEVETEEEPLAVAATNGHPAFIETGAQPLALPSQLKLAATAKPRASSRRKAFGVAALVLMLTLVAGGIYFRLSNRAGAGAATGPVKSIAVMPFKTIGANNEDDFLGLGMADAIITRLGKTAKINVSPIDAVRRYDEKGADAAATARALGAETVLTGNIQRDGEKTRVTVQLVRVADNQSLWTDSFDEKSSDIFTLQDKISQRLAGALTLRLSGDERRNSTKPPTQNVEAYNLYLQGRFHLAKRHPEAVQKAIRHFAQAARLDADFALAYAGLADAYALTASGLPPLERFPKAKSAALRALALDETLAEAHTSLAFILYKFEWNWLEAENHFRRAVQINPHYAPAHHWFGEMLGLLGRFEEGLDELREAERLDPLSQPIKSDMGRILYRARRYDEAVAYANKTLELDPNYRNAYTTIMYANEMRGNYFAAVEANLNYLRLSGFSPAELAQLKAAFASGGWQNYWRAQLDMRRQSARNEFLQAYTLTEIYLRLGENERAFESLEKSFDERGDAPYFVRAEPLLDPLRANPRFQYLVRRAGL